MPSFAVVMIEPSYAETIGLIARAMRNFGLRDLRLVNSIAQIDGQARMRASHAQDVLENTRLYASLQEALADLDLAVGTTAQRAHSLYRVLRRPATPKEFAEQVAQVQGTVGLLLGREGTGLTNNELGLCDMIVTIPSSEQYPTLNVSHAAAILFYELFGPFKGSPSDILASAAVRKIILEFLERSALDAGTNRDEASLARRALTNILGRSAIRAREASILAGVLRNISINLAKTCRTSAERASDTTAESSLQ